MKNFLLTIWNFLFDTKQKLVNSLFSLHDFVYRRLKKPPEVLTNLETIDLIVKNRCSVSRFGDGEIKLATGKDISFQTAQPLLQQKLQSVLACDDSRLLVCIPNVFESLSHFTETDGIYWKNHLSRYRKHWYRFSRKNKIYGNAFISRVYMCFNEKEKAQDYFNALKKIWNGRDIVLVEGEKSRLGFGNDLFDNAHSIRRILGPSAFAFSRYEELLAEARKLEKSALIILAMGPVGSVLPYDLLDDGYQAVDLGNIDTEYEWFLRGNTKKTPIENKMVYEAGAGQDVGELDDETYQSQIIARVTG
ncbi:MAG: SP_1767 family glycosyltransferase [Clostridiales bacterium]|nr:SP_1767 family glycosyltransferase [Clostridiales bacterium]